MTRQRHRDVTLVRLARSAPSAPLVLLAVQHAHSLLGAQKTLEELTPRGRCAALAARTSRTDHRHQMAAMSHRACPPPFKRTWIGFPDRKGPAGMSCWAARGHGHPAVARDELVSAAAIGSSSAVAHRSCPPAVLDHLAADPDPDRRKIVAQNLNCPPWLLARLAADDDYVVAIYSRRNPACGSGLIELHARSDKNHIREDVARNPGCGPELLEQLASDTFFRVREGVARNSSCSPDLVNRLAQDSNSVVRWAAASHRHCAPANLTRLADNSAIRVRQSGRVEPQQPFGAAGPPSRGLRGLCPQERRPQPRNLRFHHRVSLR